MTAAVEHLHTPGGDGHSGGATNRMAVGGGGIGPCCRVACAMAAGVALPVAVRAGFG
jgi:hypothetical protein